MSRFEFPGARIGRRQVVTGLAAAPLLAAASAVAAADGFDPAPTVRALARATRDEYHDAALGAAVADRLIAALRARRFAGATAETLAAALNGIIAAASRDAHFVVMRGDMHGMQPVPPTPPHGETAPFSESELRVLRRENFGIGAAELLAGNVGRIEFRTQFYRPAAEVRRRLGDAMSFLSDSWGLIIDVSSCYGGDPKGVALFLSYFFDGAPRLLNRFRWRNLPVEEFHTVSDPGGPHFGEQRPIALVVSGNTFSAAEELAYDIRAMRRGIVVGRKTAGAANHALPVALPGGFTAFIPMARAENPVTGTNWEGVGIIPDIEADPARRTPAHRAVLERIAASPDRDRAAAARLALSRLPPDRV